MTSTKSGESDAQEAGCQADPQSGASAQPRGSGELQRALWRGPVRAQWLAGNDAGWPSGWYVLEPERDDIGPRWAVYCNSFEDRARALAAALNAAPAGCGCRATLLAKADELTAEVQRIREACRRASVFPVIDDMPDYAAGVLRDLAARLPAPPAAEGAELAQAQYSVTTQLRELSRLAVGRGLYDADDLLKRAAERLAAAEQENRQRIETADRWMHRAIAAEELTADISATLFGRTGCSRDQILDRIGGLENGLQQAEQARDAALAEVELLRRFMKVQASALTDRADGYGGAA